MEEEPDGGDPEELAGLAGVERHDLQNSRLGRGIFPGDRQEAPVRR